MLSAHTQTYIYIELYRYTYHIHDIYIHISTYIHTFVHDICVTRTHMSQSVVTCHPVFIMQSTKPLALGVLKVHLNILEMRCRNAGPLPHTVEAQGWPPFP